MANCAPDAASPVMGDEGRARVEAIFIYPVKSCRGIAVERATIAARGFRWDREWMVVDGRGRMQTQRVEPKLALVETALPPEALDEGNWSPLPPGAALCLTAPGMEPLQVPLEPRQQREVVEHVSVWKWGGSALDEGPIPAEWFSRYLQKPVRLVKFDTDRVEWPADSTYAPGGFHITFTDGFPFLVASSASLEALNDELPAAPMPINRFRPNLLVDGETLEAFEEDSWRTFRVGDNTFYGVKPCSRCKITTIDQYTGEVGKEPLQVMATFRAGKHLAPTRPRMKHEVYFAMNAVCEESLKPGSRASVHLGDSVDVIHRHKEFGARIVAA